MKPRGIYRLLLLILTAFLFLPGVPVHSAPALPKVLLLYDSLAQGTDKEGNVKELQQLLAAYSVQVTLVSMDDYKTGAMDAYNRVISIVNTADLTVPEELYREIEDYQGQYLHIGYQPPARLKQVLQLSTGVIGEERADLDIGGFSGSALKVRDASYIAASSAKRIYGSLTLKASGRQVPFAVSGEQFTYAPYLQQGDASVIGMAYVLKEWLGVSAQTQTYLVLREIYPFSDFALLEETADRLYQAGIPFIASVRPVFSNTDYPAMSRYLDALKVVQSRNGSILVNAPVVMPSINSSDHSLGDKMNGFINLLVKSGIAPLGIGADAHWTYDKEYAGAGMSFFDSAVLFPDETVIYMDQTNLSKTFDSSLYSITPEFLARLQHSGKVMPQFPFNTALTHDLPADKAGLEELLRTLDAAWISFSDYKQGVHKVVTDVNTIVSSGGAISVNGKELNVDYVPEAVDNDYRYKEAQVKSFTRLFSVQNQFFIVVIIAALLLFGGLLIIGYRLYRRKFLK